MLKELKKQYNLRKFLDTIYNPKTEYERKIFPNFGYALVIDGISEYIGRIGVIVQKQERDNAGPNIVRIVFADFWERLEDESIDDRRDSTYCFENEWIEIS